MPYVDIVEEAFDGPGEVLARVVLGDNNTVTVIGTDDMREWIERMTINVGDRDYTVKDGISFLEVLKVQYSGSRVRASDVIFEEGEKYQAGDRFFRVVHGRPVEVGELFEVIDGKPDDARFHEDMLGDDMAFGYQSVDLPTDRVPTHADFDRARELFAERLRKSREQPAGDPHAR
jgi:hypothetical protein